MGESKLAVLFGIKLFHIVVFVVENAAILVLLFSGVFNVRGPEVVVAVILVLAEVVIFVANGRHCPLTHWPGSSAMRPAMITSPISL